MLHYHKLEKTDHYLLCCEPDPNPNGGTGDCCYDTWTTDIAIVSAKLKEVTAYADHKQKHYDVITLWYSSLKSWCDDWDKADNLAEAVCRKIELFIFHLQKVCMVTEKTAKAIEILFCMIRELYAETDVLKEKYDELYKCIKCLKQPELESGAIRACLDAYGVKLDAVIATRDDIIAKVILALELAYGMHDYICDKRGVKGILHYWEKVLNCDGKNQQEHCGDCPKEPQLDDEGNYICKLWPTITFPLCSDPYYKHMQWLKGKAKEKMLELKRETNAANQEKSLIQASKDGLANAIQAVDNSGKCK